MDLMKKKKQELVDIILRKDDIDKKRIAQINSCTERIQELKEEISNYETDIITFKNNETYQKYVIEKLQNRISTLKRYNRTWFSLLLCSIIAIIVIIVF